MLHVKCYLRRGPARVHAEPRADHRAGGARGRRRGLQEDIQLLIMYVLNQISDL